MALLLHKGPLMTAAIFIRIIRSSGSQPVTVPLKSLRCKPIRGARFKSGPMLRKHTATRKGLISSPRSAVAIDLSLLGRSPPDTPLAA